MKRRSFFTGVFFLVVIPAALLGIRIDVLRVDDLRRGGTILIVPAGPGETFSLTYTHSVERSPGTDYFRIDENRRLVLYATEFHSSNAGLPSGLADGEKLSRNDGRFRISGMHRVLPEVSFWVGKAYGNKLTVRDREYDLPRLAGEAPLTLRSGTVTAAGMLFFKLQGLAAGKERRITKG